MSDFQHVLKNIEERRNRILQGKYNCIPLPFPRFRQIFPGIEQGKYVIVTANQKIGKSKFVDKMFIYDIIFFIKEHPELKVKVLYFTLEMSKQEKYCEYLSHLLFRLDGLNVSTTDLKSTDKENPITQEILDLLQTEKYQEYIKLYENTVIYFEDIKNPTGINKICREYAEKHGHYNYIDYETTDERGIEVTKKMLDPINPYEQDDPDEYRVIIQDNAANLTTESGLDLRETINKMSKYNILLRKQLNYIIVLVQHQAQSQEGIENLKLDRMKPTTDGLADCKVTSRDANIIIGLYSPFKYGKREFNGYDITRLKNYCRFMEILEDRDYGANGNICPLFFNGAVSQFEELPLPTDKEQLDLVYSYIDTLENKKKNHLYLLNKKVKKNGKNFNSCKKRLWKVYFNR